MRSASNCACLRRPARIIPREAAVVFSRPPQLGLRVCKDRRARKDEASSRASFLGLFILFFSPSAVDIARVPVCLPACRSPAQAKRVRFSWARSRQQPSIEQWRGESAGKAIATGRERARAFAGSVGERGDREMRRCAAARRTAGLSAYRCLRSARDPRRLSSSPHFTLFLFSLALHNFFLLLQSGSGAVNNAGRAEENAALS